MICSFSLLLFVHLAASLQEIEFSSKNNTTSGHSFHDTVLCRGCGNEITFSSSIISKISPSSQYSYHDSLFKKDEVLIQVLMSDFFLPYPMITANQSNCVGISEWDEEDSWFPGYRWKPCVCTDCGALVGWVFESIDPNFLSQPGTFFGLILTSLIDESCKYTLFGCYKFRDCHSRKSVQLVVMTAAESLSTADEDFLAKCEEEFKDRYTEKDEEFMKVHGAEPSAPPIMETWWVSQNSGRRNDRRFNRRSHPFERNRDRRSRNDNEYDNKDEGHRNYNRPRYY